jgi:predicted secreted Zn-dependent protease
MLVKFVLSKFDKVFITYDLDASNSVEKYLGRLNLKKNRDFISIGVNQPGKEAIEGLLPNKVLSKVNASETDLIMKLGSQNSKVRKDARNKLKKLYLDEFIRTNSFSKEELSKITHLIKTINKKFIST